MLCIVFVSGLPINIIILIGWRGFRGKLLGFCFIENVMVILKVGPTTQKDLLISIWWSWRMFLIFRGWSLVLNYLMVFSQILLVHWFTKAVWTIRGFCTFHPELLLTLILCLLLFQDCGMEFLPNLGNPQILVHSRLGAGLITLICTLKFCFSFYTLLHDFVTIIFSHSFYCICLPMYILHDNVVDHGIQIGSIQLYCCLFFFSYWNDVFVLLLFLIMSLCILCTFKLLLFLYIGTLLYDLCQPFGPFILFYLFIALVHFVWLFYWSWNANFGCIIVYFI